MHVLDWSKSEVDYGRKLMDSAVEGARRGEGEFLQDESLGHYFERAAMHAMGPTVLGACLGWFGSHLENRHSKNRALACAVLGGVIGFGASLVWENRKLTASVVSSAWKSINKTRDAHWLEKNPIDYA